MIASFGSSKPYYRHAFDLSIGTNPNSLPSEAPLRYGKLPEIRYTFKPDPSSPPKIVTFVFAATVVAALPLLSATVKSCSLSPTEPSWSNITVALLKCQPQSLIQGLASFSCFTFVVLLLHNSYGGSVFHVLHFLEAISNASRCRRYWFGDIPKWEQSITRSPRAKIIGITIAEELTMRMIWSFKKRWVNKLEKSQYYKFLEYLPLQDLYWGDFSSLVEQSLSWIPVILGPGDPMIPFPSFWVHIHLCCLHWLGQILLEQRSPHLLITALRPESSLFGLPNHRSIGCSWNLSTKISLPNYAINWPISLRASPNDDPYELSASLLLLNRRAPHTPTIFLRMVAEASFQQLFQPCKLSNSDEFISSSSSRQLARIATAVKGDQWHFTDQWSAYKK